MNLNMTWFNGIIILSLVIYFLYDHKESRHIKDEREELIQLKTFEWVQKVNMFTLLFLSLVNLTHIQLNGVYVIFILILSSLYSEIFAKFYFRKKY